METLQTSLEQASHKGAARFLSPLICPFLCSLIVVPNGLGFPPTPFFIFTSSAHREYIANYYCKEMFTDANDFYSGSS